MDEIKEKMLPQVRAVGRSMTQDADHVKQRIIPFLTSDATRDSFGDRIEPDGWDLKEYGNRPLWLWGHDRGGLPIGQSTKHGIEVIDGRRALVQYPKFASKDEYPFADTIYKLHLGGYLRSCSVGFLPIDVHVPKDTEERTSLGLGKYGVLYRKQKLQETSSVSLPANPAANQLSIRSLVERGVLTAEDIEAIDADGEHFGRSFAVPLREEWGRVRAGSTITVPTVAVGIDPAQFEAMLKSSQASVVAAITDAAGRSLSFRRDLRAAVAEPVDPDGLTLSDQIVLLTEGIEGLAREVREARVAQRVDGGDDSSGGATVPVPEIKSDPVPSDADHYALLLNVKASAELFGASARGQGHGKRDGGEGTGTAGR